MADLLTIQTEVTQPIGIGLTRRQLLLLNFIRQFMLNHGVGPTFVEMKDALGLKSNAPVAGILKKLEERGKIRRIPAHARAIELI